MRILWITDRYPPLKGGMAVSCARQCAGLRRRNLDLDVIAFTERGPLAQVRSCARDGGADYHLSRGVDPGATAQWAWHIVQREHAILPYTVAVGFGASRPGHLAATFAAWLDIPLVVLVRGNDFDRDWFEPRRGMWVREALERARMIGAVSPEKVLRIQRLYPGKEVRWTPNGVDVTQWDLLPAGRTLRDEVRETLGGDGRRIVGIFGEMKFKKRVPLWLGALRDTGLMDRVGLLVVGKTDSETDRILADPVLVPKTHRIPFCRRETLPGLYAACDFIAIPSLFEGMPNVLLEAMACGVVPIASDAGAMEEIIHDGRTGFLFPAEDRVAAAQATHRALGLSNAALSTMTQEVKEYAAANFTVDRELDILCDMLAGAQGLPGDPPVALPGDPPVALPGDPPVALLGDPPVALLGDPPVALPGDAVARAARKGLADTPAEGILS